MKNTIAVATFVLLGAGVAAVGAQLPNLRGSDTLEDVTQFMLAPGPPSVPGRPVASTSVVVAPAASSL